MNRRNFIVSQGATCKNWAWSWSFINKQKKTIIFGAWDDQTKGSESLILEKSWEYSHSHRKQCAYPEALEHIRLVEEEGYTLKTFPIFNSPEKKDKNGIGPSAIGRFEPNLTTRNLRRVGSKWYASDAASNVMIPEEVTQPEKFIEGTSVRVSVNAYERSAKARAICIRHYGAICAVCTFDFQTAYGKIGVGVIHMHHLVPLSKIKKAYKVDPINDLRPVCPNCHAIIHKTQPAQTIAEMKKHLDDKRV